MDIAIPISVGLGIVILVNLVEKHQKWTFLVDVFWAFAALMGSLLGIGILLAAELRVSWVLDTFTSITLGVLILLPSYLVLFCLLPFIRQRLSRVFPLDPKSPLHMSALFISFYLLLWSFLNLTIGEGIEGLKENAETFPVSLYVLQSLGFASFAFVGVGLFVRRNGRQVIKRLGLDKLNWRNVMYGMMAVIIMIAIDISISKVWSLVAPEQLEELSQVSDIMFGDFDSVPLVVLLAVLSSLSEELLFRGALQPRLGLWFTSILFASIHIQYSISPATLVVFLLGIVLGLLRKYFGTWTSIFAHFGYNLLLLLVGLAAKNMTGM